MENLTELFGLKANLNLNLSVGELNKQIVELEKKIIENAKEIFADGFKKGCKSCSELNEIENDKSHAYGFDDGYDFGYEEGYDTCLSEFYEIIMHTHHLPFNLDNFEDLKRIIISILKNVKLKQEIIGAIDGSWKQYCYPIIKELNQIKTNRTKIVENMGGFGSEISYYFTNDKRFTFINYDYGLSKEKIEDHSVEICILCLVTLVENCNDYVKEAYRILESGGKLYIMETKCRDKLKTLLEESGFQIDSKKSSVEKFSLFVCTK